MSLWQKKWYNIVSYTMKLKTKIALFALAAVLMPVSVFAGGKFSKINVYVGADEVIDGNYVAAARTVTIEGTINGDVIVAGRNIMISGAVSGDVIAAGCQVNVSGPVQGDVRLAGCDVTLSGVVGRNATIIAGNVELTKDSSIGWGVMVLADNFQAFGSIAKDLRGKVENALLNGKVGEDVWLKVKGHRGLVIQPGAWIGGDLIYASGSLASIMTGATIIGEVDFKPYPGKYQLQSRFTEKWLSLTIIKLIGLWLLGFLLVWLYPKKFAKASKLLHKNFWPHLGWGILAVVLIPIIAFFLLLTMVGWALSFVLAGLYLAAVFIAIVTVSTCFGEWLLKKITGRHWRSVSLYWSMILGVFLFVVATSVPLLGFVLKLLIIATGLGVLMYLCNKEKA